nr:3-deoxy-7-phosphoheptulonate synthase [Nocardia arthritidis]
MAALPARQQPDWGDPWLISKVRTTLSRMPALTEWGEIRDLSRSLAEAAAGRAQIIQAGDCAEDPAECTPEFLTRKFSLLETLGAAMHDDTGRPVIHVGRIAGQFAKPRSRPTERHGDREIPSYRGPMVNDPRPDRRYRQPDPMRLLTCFQAASSAMAYLRYHEDRHRRPRIWTSHEVLVLDYELSALRRSYDGRLFLASTHWPWIGDRTRQLSGAHVELLASVANPVACKVGPTMTEAELLALCRRLDPARTPGRLTLISRLGADLVADRLPHLVAAVRSSGHPVLWLCDPMHGNTIAAPDGHKTRMLGAIIREVTDFRTAVRSGGGVAAGLHLEATSEQVDECVTDLALLDGVERRYTSLCDPRLNPEQAGTVIEAWTRDSLVSHERNV